MRASCHSAARHRAEKVYRVGANPESGKAAVRLGVAVISVSGSESEIVLLLGVTLFSAHARRLGSY